MHRILFIDAYDSFSNNIIALLQETLPVSVCSIRIDDARFVLNDDAFFDFLQTFDAVVAGPGPGHPSNSQDIGLIAALWRLPNHQILPVLGICLGFQSLALSLGATISRLDEPRHGRSAPTEHCDQDIFSNAGQCIVTQYHSLYAEFGVQQEAIDRGLFRTSKKCPDLVPLAWDLTEDKPVLMGMKHRSKPFWGVQFHPESICTNNCGEHIIREWFQAASTWSEYHRELPSRPVSSSASSISEARTPPNEEYAHGKLHRTAEFINQGPTSVSWRMVPSYSRVTPTDILSWARATSEVEPVLLESGCRDGKPVNPETGRYSIVGLRGTTSFEVKYRANILSTLRHGRVDQHFDMGIEQAFEFLDTVVHLCAAVNGPSQVPFWGGLVGFISYEAGLETISVSKNEASTQAPDIWFVFVDRCLVIDHVEETIYVQSIRENDEAWIHDTTKHLRMLPESVRDTPRSTSTQLLSQPAEEEYCKKVELCQEYLRAGDSYELCLTDETLIGNDHDPLSLYRTLCETNPAPFAAYLRFGPDEEKRTLDFVGSSPERFLSWSRSDHGTSTCQYRPIKGTVKKSETMTRAKAEDILKSDKEQAENLMIVDLIRHDLNGVPGVGPVRVPKLMSIEEYETVYQLVSVIEGDVSYPCRGLQALARSLPPGSMTGAPKKRSCELLGQIEGRQRGLYSGVLGYLDVGGGGDFSVVIRSAFRWGNDSTWRIGAGGAITALSTANAEWEEMLAKRERLLSVFL